MIDRLLPVAFVAGVIVLATLYGIFAARWDWFPKPQVELAEYAIHDLSSHWKNDLELEPTRHLVDARRVGREADDPSFFMHQAEAAQPGFVMVAGLSPDQDQSVHAVTLYDDSGQRVHRWPVYYSLLDPEGLKPHNVMLHGMEVFPDGSLALSFDAGNVIARIDACGQPLWQTLGEFHHIVTADGEGGLWSWRNETLVKLDAATGEITHTLDLREDIMTVAGGQYGVFAIRTVGRIDGMDYAEDAFHANDVEPLPAELADAFPMFEPGDLLVSLRELNLVAVLDPEDGRLIWWRHGPWHKQHDPDFQPDGTITVYDNRMGLGQSRIMRIDPATNETDVMFEGRDDTPFYSWQRGKHQVLPNGNILITESEYGRVFETRGDEVVWEREEVWDADRNLIITEARHVSQDFFEDDAFDCAASSVDLVMR